MTTQLNHVSVTCAELDRSLAFYNGLLGLTIRERGERTSEVLDAIIGLGPVRLRFAELELGDRRFLELFEYVQPAGVAVESRTCDHGNVHFAVEVDDIEAVHRRLTAAGIVTRSDPVLITSGDWTGARAFYSVDPDGVTVECIQFPATRPRGRVLVLQHEHHGPAGSLGEWAAARGFELEVLMADEEWSAPSVDSFAFVVSLGSESAAYDNQVPWLARELELLDRAHRARVPVLGICFGSQILARSLGAATRRADRSEVGWYEVESSDPASITPGPWLFWHDDRFDVPLGGELLARTDVGPAAFRAGRSMGIQFHPEVTDELLETWIALEEESLAAEVRDQLRHVAQAQRGRFERRAFQLYDLFLANAF